MHQQIDPIEFANESLQPFQKIPRVNLERRETLNLNESQ